MSCACGSSSRAPHGQPIPLCSGAFQRSLQLDLQAQGDDRALAERLAASGQLRPGCSLKEAEDVIGALTSFPVFDRLHKDGRRSSAAVGEILLRLAAAILAA